MANVFICHRGDDTHLARTLAVALEAAGHAIWFDEWEIQVGDSIIEKIDQGLSRAGYLVLCVSGSGDSGWTKAEWQAFLSLELNGSPVKLLPVILSGGTPPTILASRKYVDLTRDWHGGVQSLMRAIV